MSVKQVLGAAGRGLGASGMGDGRSCQAVLYVLVHVHSGGPGLPEETDKTEDIEMLGLLFLIIVNPLNTTSSTA